MKISPYIAPGIFNDTPLTLEEELALFSNVAIKRYKSIFVVGFGKSIPITEMLIRSRHRYNGATYLKQMFIYYLKVEPKKVIYTYSSIARFFKVDHTTIMHNYKAFKSQLDINSKLPPGLAHINCTVNEDYSIMLDLMKKARYKL